MSKIIDSTKSINTALHGRNSNRLVNTIKRLGQATALGTALVLGTAGQAQAAEPPPEQNTPVFVKENPAEVQRVEEQVPPKSETEKPELSTAARWTARITGAISGSLLYFLVLRKWISKNNENTQE